MNKLLKIFVFIRSKVQIILIKNILKKKFKFNVKEFNYLSFNGRTISFSFIDEKNKKKYFLKKFLYKDKDFHQVQIQDIINRKYKFVSKLKEEKLLFYNFYKFENSHQIYVRDYIHGETLLDYFQKIDTDNFKIKIKETIMYLIKILNFMKDNKLYYSLDLHLNNFIITQDGKVNIIDLDLVYIELKAESFESDLIIKFFLKSLKYFNERKKRIFFETLNDCFNPTIKFNKILIDFFFYDKNDSYLNDFIFNNYGYFNTIPLSFNNNISIKEKLISTLKSLPYESYVVARRYDWLIKDSCYQTKDIDIFFDNKYLSDILKIFVDNGWDLYNGLISQYFESQNILVSIDLINNFEHKFNISFEDLLKKADRDLGINMISKYDYANVMLKNFFTFKKNIKTKHLLEIRDYYSQNKQNLSEYSNKILNKNYFKYNDKTYSSLLYLFKVILGDFIKYKEVVFIGADGAGKSTMCSIIYNNVSFYVSSKKKYFSGFFFPSGRTNLFYIKTSKLFLLIKRIKDSYYLKIKNKFFYSSNRSILLQNSRINNFRTTKNLRLFYIQLFLVVFSPVFIFDSWLHKFTNRLTLYRVSICDRYYDDILINYTNIYIRKLLKYLIPNSKNKFYLYAKPEEHFNRKRNEDIEMIIHMQKCYTENEKYLKKFPTNINQTLINKKILKMVINTL